MTKEDVLSWSNGLPWDILNKEKDESYFKSIQKFIIGEIDRGIIIYPDDVFRAFKLCSWENLKVVLTAQDPYHGEGEANGLCFSVNKGISLPPSLRNIFKELKDDIGITRENGDFTELAKQGILFLNSILTVQKDSPASHKSIGWHMFTNSVIDIINKEKKNVAFILWGKHAQSKKDRIIDKFIVESNHPSPFSAHKGFFNSKPFSKVNYHLRSIGLTPIDWSI